MIVIANDIVLSVQDLLCMLIKQHCYPCEEELSVQEKCNEIKIVFSSIKELGIYPISVKPLKDNQIEICYLCNNKKYKFGYFST